MANLYRQIRRMHFTALGTKKRALTPRQAQFARHRGLNTYRCPLCGEVHCGNPSRSNVRVITDTGDAA